MYTLKKHLSCYKAYNKSPTKETFVNGLCGLQLNVKVDGKEVRNVAVSRTLPLLQIIKYTMPFIHIIENFHSFYN